MVMMILSIFGYFVGQFRIGVYEVVVFFVEVILKIFVMFVFWIVGMLVVGVGMVFCVMFVGRKRQILYVDGECIFFGGGCVMKLCVGFSLQKMSNQISEGWYGMQFKDVLVYVIYIGGECIDNMIYQFNIKNWVIEFFEFKLDFLNMVNKFLNLCFFW